MGSWVAASTHHSACTPCVVAVQAAAHHQVSPPSCCVSVHSIIGCSWQGLQCCGCVGLGCSVLLRLVCAEDLAPCNHAPCCPTGHCVSMVHQATSLVLPSSLANRVCASQANGLRPVCLSAVPA